MKDKKPKLGGKTYCDCPCSGPFCNSLFHPCSKPDEHYDQSLLPLAEAKQEGYDEGYKDGSERLVQMDAWGRKKVSITEEPLLWELCHRIEKRLEKWRTIEGYPPLDAKEVADMVNEIIKEHEA